MTGRVVFQPLGKSVPAVVVRDLLDIAQRAGVGIIRLAGIGICGNCRVRVGARISELNTASWRRAIPTIRLVAAVGLQAVVLDDDEDIVVDVPRGRCRRKRDWLRASSVRWRWCQPFESTTSPRCRESHDLRGRLGAAVCASLAIGRSGAGSATLQPVYGPMAGA